MTTLLQSVAALVARVLLSQIFLISAIGHLSDWGARVKAMIDHGMALQSLLGGAGVVFVHLLHTGAVTFLVLGGLSVLLGVYSRCGAMFLILFLIPTTLIFHAFWSDPAQIGDFMKNTGLAGGLLMVLAYGSGIFSLDAFWPRRRASPA